jgi:hypothetical protein
VAEFEFSLQAMSEKDIFLYDIPFSISFLNKVLLNEIKDTKDMAK